MAVRRATRIYPDIKTFLSDLSGTLKDGAILLPPDCVDDELAPEIKLDLEAPLLGRVGPITAQVVHRSPAGTAMQLPKFDAEAGAAITKFWAAIDDIEGWLIAEERVSATTENDPEAETEALVKTLQARVAELEAALASGAGAGAGDGEASPSVSSSTANPTSTVSGRGFAVPDLSNQEPSHSGSLSDGSLRETIMSLTGSLATGLLTVKLDDGRIRYGFWSRGGPVGWRTDPLQENEVLGVLLYKAGQLTREQLQESVERMQRDSIRQGEALMEMGLVGFSQLTMILGKQCEFLFTRVLTEREGTWVFHELDDLPEKFLPAPLRIPSLLFRREVEASKAMPSTELADYLRPRIDEYIHFDKKLLPLLRDVKFTAAETKLVATMQSDTWRSREVLSVSPLSKQNTVAVLRALIEVGFLEFEQQEDEERYHRRVREMVEEKRRHLIKATHFDVLEVHWISLPREIEDGYRRLREKYDPSNHRGLPEEVVEGLKYVRTRLKESFEYLRDDQQRREHRKEFIEVSMIVQSAELLAKQGEMGIMRKDRRHSPLCFAKALELVPGRPDFREGFQRASAVV